MKTVTYNDILYRAAEMAGRTRDKLPVSEATILRAALAVDLEDVWNKQCWPELIPDPVQVDVESQQFDKDEDEMGDVLTVLTANPLVTTKWRLVGFQERDGAVWIDENRASVWVEYLLPMPDLMAVEDDELATYEIPQRFRAYLSLRGAGALLNADLAGSGNGVLGQAEAALVNQIQRLPPPPEWRQVRVRSGFGRAQYVASQ